MTRAYWTYAFWGCALAILALSVGPTWSTMPSTGWDKSNHLLAYFLLATLGFRAYPAHGQAVLVGAICYGTALEVLQALLPHRFGEWLDVLANGTGVAMAWGLNRILSKRNETPLR